MSGKLKIAALISGGGTNLQAILDSCENGILAGKAEVVCVGADNHDAKGLARAEKKGIYTFVADYNQIRKNAEKCSMREFREGGLGKIFPLEEVFQKSAFVHNWFDGNSERQLRHIMWKIVAEYHLLQKIWLYCNNQCGLVVLAGFMRNLTPYFIDLVNDVNPPRIMNIHPALLPAFPGTDGYGDTFRYGCRVGGCTVHFVDYGEDTGPIIGQRTFPISPDVDTLGEVKNRGLELEWELYPECIRLFAEDRLELVTNDVGRRVVKIY